MQPKRIVCWFSCGAASAVAAKLAINENAGRLPIVVAYTEIREEHPDNKRFLADCENGWASPSRYFATRITTVQFTKYSARLDFSLAQAALPALDS